MGDYLLPGIALVLFLVGAGRFFWTWKFAAKDIIWTLINLPVAAVSLALSDFLHFKTRLPLWLFGILLLAAAILSPHFSVALGVVIVLLWIYTVKD